MVGLSTILAAPIFVIGVVFVAKVICILMAIVLAIPIPGINMVAAASVAGVGLGILQPDGLVIVL